MARTSPPNARHSDSRNPIVIMGIDASATHIALVSLFGAEFNVTVSKNLGKSGPEACYNARVLTHETLDTVKKWAGDSALVHAFYELPVLGRGGFRSTAVQCFTSGSVQAVLHERKCQTYPVNVSSWKKQVVGRGNADKGQVGEYLRCGWPSLHRAAHGNQDVYDASCIAIYGRQILESRMEETG